MSPEVPTSKPNRPEKIAFKREFWSRLNLLISFKYAWAGVSYAFQTQRNFRIHVGVF